MSGEQDALIWLLYTTLGEQDHKKNKSTWWNAHFKLAGQNWKPVSKPQITTSHSQDTPHVLQLTLQKVTRLTSRLTSPLSTIPIHSSPLTLYSSPLTIHSSCFFMSIRSLIMGKLHLNKAYKVFSKIGQDIRENVGHFLGHFAKFKIISIRFRVSRNFAASLPLTLSFSAPLSYAPA